jgi:transposase
MKLSRVGVDLAKNVYQLHGVDSYGKTVWKRRLRRGQWLQVLTDTVEPGCEIGMEACTGAHHWAREPQSRGYTVRLIAPQFVKPFVKSNKNDANDAEAICEAMSRPHMRFVSVKSVEQQDIQATHRVREELKAHRNAKANQIRGLVAEYGLVAPKTLLALRRTIPEWLARSNAVTRRLQQLRGVGPLVATALVATVGDGAQYSKGRQMASALGLTPRQNSSGDQYRLFGISKRGDVYLRTQMIHGARAVVSQAKHRDDPLSRWVNDIAKRRHPNVAAVALANRSNRRRPTPGMSE